MARPTELAFYIAYIAGKGAKAASFSVSAQTGHRIGINNTLKLKGGRCVAIQP